MTLRSWPFSQLTRERKQRRVTCRTLGLCSEPAWLTYVQIPNATEKSSRPWPGWPTGRVPERRPCSARPRQSPGTGNPSSEGEAIAAGLGSEPGAGAAVPVHWLHPAAAVRRASPVALPPTVSFWLLYVCPLPGACCARTYRLHLQRTVSLDHAPLTDHVRPSIYPLAALVWLKFGSTVQHPINHYHVPKTLAY